MSSLAPIDWKPLQQTIVTLEEVVTHYKNDSYFILNPNQYTVQEANGLPVSLGNWDVQTPYAASNCNTNSIATARRNPHVSLRKRRTASG